MTTIENYDSITCNICFNERPTDLMVKLIKINNTPCCCCNINICIRCAMILQERKYQDRKCPICRINYFKYAFCDLINNNNEDNKDNKDEEDNEDHEDNEDNENTEDNEDEYINEIQNMSETFYLLKFGNTRYAIKNIDRVKIMEHVDEWLNIYKTQDGSRGRFVLMSRYDTLIPVGKFNPRTKKVRLLRRLM